MPIPSVCAAVAATLVSMAVASTAPAMAPRQAPDFVGATHWLNSSPLRMDDLRGKVVLVDFWDYSCSNCLHTQPYLNRWYATYADKGLVVVGVHTPEFEFERDTANVQDAVRRLGIRYPVAQDNARATWTAWNNRYWPTEYLVDRQGNVVMRQIGEGRYQETENRIRALLGMAPLDATEPAAPETGSRQR